MTEHANLTAALVAAQAAFGEVKKGKKVEVNTQKGRYSYTYADLGTTLEAVMPALHANGLALVQPMEVREGKAGIITRLMHTSGDTLEGWTPLSGTMTTAQDMGSAITYARRYGLTALLCLAAEDDDGAAASRPPARDLSAQRVQKPEPQPERDIAPPPADPVTGEIATPDPLLAGRKKMYATAKGKPLEWSDEQIKRYLLETFKVTSSKELDEGQLNVALQHFTRLKNQKLREQPVELGDPTF
jgi:hypothetical protein